MKKILKTILWILLALALATTAMFATILYQIKPVTLPDCGNYEIESKIIKRLNVYHIENVDHVIYEKRVTLRSNGVETESSENHKVCQCEIEISYPNTKKPDEIKIKKYEFRRWTGNGNGFDTQWVGN